MNPPKFPPVSDQYIQKASFNDLVVEINCKDITCAQDDWDIKEYASKTVMGKLLHHPAFKILLATLVISSAVAVGLETEPSLVDKYIGLFTTIDNIVLSFLFCEVLFNWYYGFALYWKDGWNILNFFIMMFLFLDLTSVSLNNPTLTKVVRIMRLMQVCTLVSGLARMIQVILKSIPDMANIMILLFAIMLAYYKSGSWPVLFHQVFSVFGVTLFGSLVPKHFGNLGTALYSLFICVTQDGWINIYNDFEGEGLALEIGGALYFIIFITFGAFIFANLLVAVVTTNLEQSMTEYHEKKQSEAQSSSSSAYARLDDGTEDDFAVAQPEPLHVREVIHDTPMTHQQDLLSFGNLSNLNEATCENLCLVLEAIHENLKEYQEIRIQLDQIVEEVRSIRFNIEQEQEIVLRNIRAANISDTGLTTEGLHGKAADVLSALISLDKKHMLDREYQKGAVKLATLRALRQNSITPEETARQSRRQTLPAELDKHQSNPTAKVTQGKGPTRRSTVPAGSGSASPNNTARENVAESLPGYGSHCQGTAPGGPEDQSQRPSDSMAANNTDQRPLGTKQEELSPDKGQGQL